VAVLRPYVGSSYHVTRAAYSCERGGHITQLQYFLHLSLRTSENSVKRKFDFGGSTFHALGCIALPPMHQGSSAGIIRVSGESFEQGGTQ
jgi:hypothetical protein